MTLLILVPLATRVGNCYCFRAVLRAAPFKINVDINASTEHIIITTPMPNPRFSMNAVATKAGPTPPRILPRVNTKFDAVALTLVGYNSLIQMPR